MSDAPDSSPPQTTEPNDEIRLKLQRPLILLAGCLLAGAILGTVAGGLIGLYAPAYYFEVFNAWDNPDFDPLQMGLGLGFLQGGGTGLVIGAGLIGVTAWWKASRTEPTEDWPWPTQTLSGRWLPVIAVGVVVAVLAGGTGFMAGLLAGQNSTRTVLEMLQCQLAIEQVAHRPEFSGIEVVVDTDGRVKLEGSVPTPAAQDELHQHLRLELSVVRAAALMQDVAIELGEGD